MIRQWHPATIVALGLIVVGCGGKQSGGPTGPTGPGNLAVSSSPMTAQVKLLDGTATFSTPHEFDGIAVGDHVVRLSFVGYADTVISVHVSSTATATLSATLRPLAGTPRSFALWKSYTSSVNGLDRAPDGAFYALTGTSENFHVYAADGSTITNAQVEFGLGAMGSPYINSFGDAYYRVSGSQGYYVHKHARDGHLWDVLNKRNTAVGFNIVDGITIGIADTLYVVDSDGGGGYDLEKYNVNDVWTNRTWHLPSGFIPGPILVDADNFTYICNDKTALGDSGTVYKFDSGGNLQSSWRTHGARAATLAPDGTIYVASTTQLPVTAEVAGEPVVVGRIQRFSPSGALLEQWGVENPQNPSREFFSIGGIAVDGPNVYVADPYGKRILKFTY